MQSQEKTGGKPESPESLSRRRARYRELLEESVRRAVAALSSLEEVERISLVGSYAKGRADLSSDLDLVVVMRTDLPLLERLRALYPLLALPVDLDLLCYTPEEFEAVKEEPFFRNLLREEVILFAKNAP